MLIISFRQNRAGDERIDLKASHVAGRTLQTGDVCHGVQGADMTQYAALVAVDFYGAVRHTEETLEFLPHEVERADEGVDIVRFFQAEAVGRTERNDRYSHPPARPVSRTVTDGGTFFDPSGIHNGAFGITGFAETEVSANRQPAGIGRADTNGVQSGIRKAEECGRIGGMQ